MYFLYLYWYTQRFQGCMRDRVTAAYLNNYALCAYPGRYLRRPENTRTGKDIRHRNGRGGKGKRLLTGACGHSERTDHTRKDP